MSNEGKKTSDDRSSLAAQIGEKADRKLKGRRLGEPVWFGLGMIGLIGWSVVVPALLGAALGVWLDKTHPSAFSWTLSLMVGGLAIGCLNAWYWVAQQDKAMRADTEDADE
jgi:ATP synthase protein I